MTEKTKITQDINGSNNIQVGQQVVNCYGLTVENALTIANDLFKNNFPQLAEEAREIARRSAEEFFISLSEKLKKLPNANLSVFNQPAVQHALYQGIKNFVTYPDQQKKDLITDMIVERVIQNDSEICAKVAIDKAIETAAYLNQEQLDYLTFVFCVKCVKFHFQNVEELNDYLKYIAESYVNVSNRSLQYLISLGCLQIQIGSASDTIKRIYSNFEATSIKVPEIFNLIPGDYGVSYMGRALCVINARKKLNLNVNLENFLK